MISWQGHFWTATLLFLQPLSSLITCPGNKGTDDELKRNKSKPKTEVIFCKSKTKGVPGVYEGQGEAEWRSSGHPSEAGRSLARPSPPEHGSSHSWWQSQLQQGCRKDAETVSENSTKMLKWSGGCGKPLDDHYNSIKKIRKISSHSKYIYLFCTWLAFSLDTCLHFFGHLIIFYPGLQPLSKVSKEPLKVLFFETETSRSFAKDPLVSPS